MTRRSITSTANSRLKAVRRLARHPRRDPLFLAEGHVAVRRALEAGWPIVELYTAPELFLGPVDGDLVALAERRGVPVYELDASVFASTTREARPDGLLAVLLRPRTELVHISPPADALIVVAAAVERPGNLGAIVRTAVAAGAHALVACDPVTDLFHPATVRGSVGNLFALALAESTADTCVAWLREHGIRIVATSPDGTLPHWGVDCRGPLALVLGNERRGVDASWLDAADEVVAIPMPGPADSLNVAVAAGVVLFEAARQRLVAPAALR